METEPGGRTDPRLWGERGTRNMDTDSMEYQSFVKELEALFQGKVFLTIDDITKAFSCEEKIITNWRKRLDAKRRPPCIYMGNEVRFPKKPFIHWFLMDQGLIKG